MSRRVWTAAVLAALGVFFGFALVGYSFLALACAGFAAVEALAELFERKGWRAPRRVMNALLASGFALFAALETPVLLACRGDGAQEAEALIVLGAGVNGSVPSLSLQNRLDAALAYLRDHPDCLAVLSGGQGPGEELSEAEVMFRVLSRRGIDPERLLQEPRAANTEQNLRFSLEVLREHGLEPEHMRLAVLSSEYHLCRAKAIAARLGYPMAGVPARTSYPLLRLNYLIREAFAMAYLCVFGV